MVLIPWRRPGQSFTVGTDLFGTLICVRHSPRLRITISISAIWAISAIEKSNNTLPIWKLVSSIDGPINNSSENGIEKAVILCQPKITWVGRIRKHTHIHPRRVSLDGVFHHADEVPETGGGVHEQREPDHHRHYRRHRQIRRDALLATLYAFVNCCLMRK